MYVPPLRPNCFDSYISGEVTIDPSAAIAPGVLLQASPNSRIIIGAGVCIGMGAILHAYEGTLEVEAGANLGAGVLVVGKGKIGANACIGATATVFDCSIESMQVVAAGTVIGDQSRHARVTASGAEASAAGDSAPTTFVSDKSQATPTTNAETNQSKADSTAQTTSEPTETPQPNRSKISGQAHLNQMLSTMFPHRQSLNRSLRDGQSPSDKT